MSETQVIVELEAVTNSCFVAMPFHKLYEAEYLKVIKPAIEEAGLTCVRGDEIYSRQAIIEDIWRHIRKSRLVVAELTSRNPNVMYEIGLAHAIGKPIIFLTRDKEDVPFDLGSLRHHEYDINYPFWGDGLRSEITRLVTQVLEQGSLGAHLTGVEVKAKQPAPPTQPVVSTEDLVSPPNLSGKWRTEWLSISQNRKHEALLDIPTNHGRSFIASMIVVYERGGQQSVVDETLTGSIRENLLSLTGISLTYAKQGASRRYSLDSFELNLAEDGKALVGKATLAQGERHVIFRREH